jgi:hypothetical protein
MKISDDYYVNFVSYIEKTLGETSANEDIVSLINWMEYEKFPDFPEEEWSVYLSKKELGFSLLFDDADILPPQWARGREPGTPIFTGCFLYSEGLEGFKKFNGRLPYGIAWTDTPSTLQEKFKEKAKPFLNKKTGALEAHILVFGKNRFTVDYKNDLSSVSQIYIGLD